MENEEYILQKLIFFKSINSSFTDFDRRQIIFEIESIFKSYSGYKTQEFDENKKNCIILIGPPNSGKTTFITDRESINEYKIYSHDKILMETYPNLSYNDAYKIKDKELINMRMKKELRNILDNNYNFIVDMMNLTNVSYQSIVTNQEFKSKYNFIAYVFFTNYDELIQRNNKRNELEGKYLEPYLIENFIKKLELPIFSNFTEVHYIVDGVEIE